MRVGLIDVPGRAPLATRPPLLVLGDTATDPTARRAARLAAQVPEYLSAGTRSSGWTGAAPAPTPSTAPTLPRGRRSSTPTRPRMDATVLLERARAVVQACNVALDGQLDGFSSEAAADDVEAVRQSLGVARLSALGTGDGAAALDDWARAHPRAVGRLILDGPPDPTRRRAGALGGAREVDGGRVRRVRPELHGARRLPAGRDPRATVTALVTSCARSR